MNKENLFEPNCIRTLSGKYINVFAPDPATIVIEDIAHSLSMQPRFGGHLPEFYSVAQHCCHCFDSVGPDFKMEALMHDASEAYLLDIPSPIKKNMPEYKAIESPLMEAIGQKFGFAWPMSETVKKIDAYMLRFEWDVLMLNMHPDMYEHFKPSNFVLPWSPIRAKKEFLNRFDYLTTSKPIV